MSIREHDRSDCALTDTKMDVAVEKIHDSDDVLLERIMQHDSKALEDFYDRHASVVYYLIMRIVRDPATAENLLQETFWQVWKKAGDFKGEGEPAAWLCRIARYKSLDHLRRQKARPKQTSIPTDVGLELSDFRLGSSLTSVEVAVEQRLEREQLQKAMSRLPREQRLCLELTYFGGMSQRQVAQLTETPLGTIKSRLRQGLKKLEYIMTGLGYRPVTPQLESGTA